MIQAYLKEQNTWWQTREVDKSLLGIKRKKYLDIIQDQLKTNRIIALAGIRRSGKTTILYQTIQKLLKQKIPPKQILYFKIDDLDQEYKLKQILDIFQEETGFDIKTKKIFVFIDEIQYLDKWQSQIKRYFDGKYPIKFFITGSSSALLYHQASESLAGRIHFIKVFPLNFSEFLNFSKIELKIQQISLFDKNFFETLKQNQSKNILLETNIKYQFRQYLEVGGFPEWFEIKQKLKWRKILKDEYFALILYKDVVRTFNIKDPLLLEHLVQEIALNSTNRFSYLNLSNKLDADKETIKLYLYYLRSALMIFMLEVYAKTRLASERKEKKFLFWEEGLRKAILGRKTNYGQALENVISWHLSILYPDREFNEGFYWRNKREVDFIVKNKDQIMPVEIKSSKQVSLTSAKGILDFMDHFSLNQAIITTQEQFEKIKINKKIIYFIPAWWLLISL